jgi:DNA-binding transcriptional regulator YiaG
MERPETRTRLRHMNITSLRKILGMSAREFGLACGLTGKNVARTVYRWQTGDADPNGASQMLIDQLKQKAKRREQTS